MNVFILFHVLTVVASFQAFYNTFYTIPKQQNYFDIILNSHLRPHHVDDTIVKGAL